MEKKKSLFILFFTKRINKTTPSTHKNTIDAIKIPVKIRLGIHIMMAPATINMVPITKFIATS